MLTRKAPGWLPYDGEREQCEDKKREIMSALIHKYTAFLSLL